MNIMKNQNNKVMNRQNKKKINKNYYYALWSDAINYQRRNGKNLLSDWKFNLFFSMSMVQSFNIATLFMILRMCGLDIGSFIHNYVDISLSKRLNSFLWAVISLYIPSALITYFSIFYKKKYIKILNEYSFENGKTLKVYMFLSFLLFFIVAFINQKY